MTKYFKNVATAEELKDAYRKLAKQLHPDMPTGDAEKFKAMQNEYEKLWSSLKDIHRNKKGETYVHHNDEKASEFMDIINILIKFKGCTIELMGSWIWVSGDTKPYKDTLKSLKFKYSGKNQAWYFFKGEYVKKTNITYSMDAKRSMFGSTEYKASDDEEEPKMLKSAKSRR